MESKCKRSKSKSKGNPGCKCKVVQKVPKQGLDKGPKLLSVGISTPLDSSRSSVKRVSSSKFETSVQFSEEARNPQNSSIKEVEYESFGDSDDELVSLLGIPGSSGKCSKNESFEELHENVLQEEPIKSFMTDSNNIQNLGFNDGHKSDWFCEEIKESLVEKDQDLKLEESSFEEQEGTRDLEESRAYAGKKLLEAFEKVERMVIKQVEKGKKIKDARERLKSLINKVKGVSENRKFVDLWVRCIRCLDILKCEDEKLKERIEKENWNIDEERKKLAEMNKNLYFSQAPQTPEVYVTALEENSQEKKEIQNEVLISDLIKEERYKYGCSLDMGRIEGDKYKFVEEDESYFADDDKTLSTAQKTGRKTFDLGSTNKKPSQHFKTIPLSCVFRGTDISGLKRRERDPDDVEYENALEEELSSIRKMMRTDTAAQVLPRAGSQETKSSDYLTKSTECPPAEEMLERNRHQNSEERRGLDFIVETSARGEDTSRLTFEGKYQVEGLSRLSPGGIEQEPNLPSS